MRYAEKRLSTKWKNRKKQRSIETLYKNIKIRRQQRKDPLNHSAPENFSLIENTNEVLKYFYEAKKLFYQKENLTFDISKVGSLSHPTIALLVASINNRNFTRKCVVTGNAPETEELQKLFISSGFYDHVKSHVIVPNKNGELLHKGRAKIVKEDVARDATLAGVKNTFGTSGTFDPLYDILIELMSNTGGHANPAKKNTCDWWLYVYKDPKSNITSYTFLDLGVGIFESKEVKGYIAQFLKDTVHRNINMVDKLLSGEIKSRMIVDNEIRGKGIPEIVGYSKMAEFREFYILTNNVKINLKTGEREELSYDLEGTLVYWELQNNHGN
jgi:hypothetical protein